VKCPKCGSEHFKESRQCPEFNSEPVCIRCCTECHYYDPAGGIACRWHIINDVRRDYSGDIYKLSRQIDSLEKLSLWLYRNNKPNAASAEEFKMLQLIGEKRRLEEERDAEENKRPGA